MTTYKAYIVKEEEGSYLGAVQSIDIPEIEDLSLIHI